MEIKNWEEVLNQAKKDDMVGISIAYLTGNEEFSVYVTELQPHSQVGAHYHQSGIEVYTILSAQGVIHTGQPTGNGEVNWHTPKQVKQGDFFTIEPGTVHQLKNPYDEKLVLVFCCPQAHLGEDRVVCGKAASQ
jgi:mannose-6-phosphate isomerase-like protein (cupin superfamily)